MSVSTNVHEQEIGTYLGGPGKAGTTTGRSLALLLKKKGITESIEIEIVVVIIGGFIFYACHIGEKIFC